ncbi:hypothetical protein AVEN_169963-1 [Araneus ventricosus]|uniref:Uncharacterized protein n=1 Tax=Araneus ventricosus TaxID=182803 RepID=A0A4Y2M1A3_ARAVE|nr:hypothetical protein AVEN_169963-1 [Araneus ventricosus]
MGRVPKINGQGLVQFTLQSFQRGLYTFDVPDENGELFYPCAFLHYAPLRNPLLGMECTPVTYLPTAVYLPLNDESTFVPHTCLQSKKEKLD